MSEPKVHKIGDFKMGKDVGIDFYLKSEADKVIAEKDAEIARLNDKLRHYPMMAALIESGNKEIAELKDRLQAADKQIENLINGASSIMLAQDRVTDNKCAELRHQKYKRCLAMAKVCYLRFVRYDNYLQKLCASNATIAAYKFNDKWEKRWLELAEKFKPNKEAK